MSVDNTVLEAVEHYFKNLSKAVKPNGKKTGMTSDDALYQLEHDLKEHYLEWKDGSV